MSRGVSFNTNEKPVVKRSKDVVVGSDEANLGTASVNMSSSSLLATPEKTLSALIASNRTQLTPLLLTFKNPKIEDEYCKSFFRKNQIQWRWINIASFFALTILYVYFTIQYSIDSKFWNSNYRDDLKTENYTCPSGVYW